MIFGGGKRTMHSDLITHYQSLVTAHLLKTEALYIANKTAWIASFSSHFQGICSRIIEQQDNAILPTIQYLEYTMLYSNFINRRYVAEITVYNEKRYLDKSQQSFGEYDLSHIFIYFNELWDKLLSERKRYVGKVKSREITTLMIEALPKFYSYLAGIARLAIREHLNKSPFTDISKNDVFQVAVGDYMACTSNVYTEKKNKDAKKLIKCFSEDVESRFTFDDFSNMDFSGHSFTLKEFCYSQFRNTCLNNTFFNNCALSGANFSKANMENCSFNSCSIHEADFSYTNLKHTSFVKARGRVGIPISEEWLFAGYLPVSFRYADLSNAHFTGANLSGADFTGAVLDGTVFTDVVLDGAIFDDGVDVRALSQN